MLERSSRTTAELRQRLARRRHPAPAIEATIGRLVDVGLLNDDAYGRQFARTRLAAGRTAPARVERELMRRGIDRQTAAAALQEVLSEDAIDVVAILDDTVRRRATTLAKLDASTRRRRLYAYLARRGFDPDEIRRALERLGGAD
jgi:regulatory protein